MKHSQGDRLSSKKLELFLSGHNFSSLSNSNNDQYQIILHLKNSPQMKWTQIGQTEQSCQSNPEFSTSIQLEYIFELQQYVKFEVFLFHNQRQVLIGTTETQVALIAGAKNQIFQLEIPSTHMPQNAQITIKSNQVKECLDEVQITLSAFGIPDTRKLCWLHTNPFLKFYKPENDKNCWLFINETKHQQSTLQPIWDDIKITMQKFCNNDYKTPIKVELYDYKSNHQHQYLGETKFSIDQLIKANDEGKTHQSDFINNNKQKKGYLKFNKFKILKRYSFLDYIKGGLKLSLMIAIDFTQSNGAQNNQQSLHFMKSNGTSQYLDALTAISTILIHYDSDQKIPVFGFGCQPDMAKIKSNNVEHCFHLNDNSIDPEVDGLEGILMCYKKALPNLKFDGPTLLHPIFEKAMNVAKDFKNNNSNNYLILLILTDGQNQDYQELVEDVINSADIPLSVIIIGMGEQDFTQMQNLDNDDLSLKDSHGRIAKRDLVQFVKYNDFKNDPPILQKEVLAELPNQIIDYMELIGRKPMVGQVFDNLNMKQPTDGLQLINVVQFDL